MEECVNNRTEDTIYDSYYRSLGNGSHDKDPLAHKYSANIAVAVLTSLLGLVIIVGNGLIIVSVTVVRKLRQPANYLIVSLALSDFLVGLVVLPLTIVYDILGGWIFGTTLCNIHVGFDVICCTTSIMNLCMISIDRYLMITRPMTYPKKRTANLMALMIAIAWIVSCLIIIPALFGFTENVTDKPGFFDLTSDLSVKKENWSIQSTTLAQSQFIDNPYDNNSDQSTSTFYDYDLHQEFRLDQIKINSNIANSSLIADLDFQILDCNGDWKKVSASNVSSVPPYAKFQPKIIARILRFNPLHIFADQQISVKNLSIYGEKLYGKTCLISQEVWFSIYSTVGAFYLPLTIMLCMYWKIYLEASRFKSRHEQRTKSVQSNHDRYSLITSSNPHAERSSISLPSTPPTEEESMKRNESVFMEEDKNENIIGMIKWSSMSETNLQEQEKYLQIHRNRSCVESTGNNLKPNEEEFAKKQQRVSFSDFSTLNKYSTVTDKLLPVNEKSIKVYTKQSSSKRWRWSSKYNKHKSNCSNGYNGNSIKNYTKDGKNCQHSPTKSNKDYLSVNSNATPITSNSRNISRASIFSGSLHSPARVSSQLSSSSSSASTQNGNPMFSKRRSTIFLSNIRRKVSLASRDRLRNVKATRTLGIIVGTFTFCWIPFFILTFIRPFVCADPESQDCFPIWLVRLVLWLGYLNSALNPIIYIGFSPDLRDTFRFLICCKCTNVDRRLAQIELRKAIQHERKCSS